MGIRLSVLDTSPIVRGSTARQALINTVDLAELAEEPGFHRYRVPEHHGMRGVAGSSPAVLAGHLAAVTSRLRVGSGGVLLPNHPPLVVAEQFGTLAAPRPGRIDLGIGRAPGGAATRPSCGCWAPHPVPRRSRPNWDCRSRSPGTSARIRRARRTWSACR